MKPIQPLNGEQRKLVEDNYGLVIDTLIKNNKSIDDYHGVAAMALCKAAIGFDASRKFKFSTYAVTAIRREVQKEIYKENRPMRNAKLTQSLDELVTDDLTLGEVIGIDSYLDDGICTEAILKKIAKLPPKQRRIVELIVLGYTQLEICKIYNDTRQNVSYLLKCARQKLIAAGVA